MLKAVACTRVLLPWVEGYRGVFSPKCAPQQCGCHPALKRPAMPQILLVEGRVICLLSVYT